MTTSAHLRPRPGFDAIATPIADRVDRARGASYGRPDQATVLDPAVPHTAGAVTGTMPSRFSHDFSHIQPHADLHRPSGASVLQRQVDDRPEAVVPAPSPDAESTGGSAAPVMEWRTVQIAGGAVGKNGDAGVPGPSDAGAPQNADAAQQGDAGAGGDGGGGDGGVPEACDPQPMARAAFLGLPGARQTDLGLTVLSGQVGVPVVSLSQPANGQVQQTSASLAPISSAFTKGTFVEGTGQFITQGRSACPGGTYPMEWNILGSGAGAVRAGELEHCTDFRLAFDLSLNRFAQAVNTVAQSGRRFRNQQAAEAFFQRQLGVAPAAWFPHFDCMANKTKIRDTSGSHTPAGVGRGTREPQPPCSSARLRFFLDAGHLPRIGRSLSSSLITPAGCPVA